MALGFVETLAVATATPASGPNAQPLTALDLFLGGVGYHARGLPVCTPASIVAAGGDGGCPSGARVAGGQLLATLWTPAEPAQAGVRCDPTIDVWNGGSGRLTYVPVIAPGHQCAGLQPGALAPWSGSITATHAGLALATTLPPDVSTDAGGLGLRVSVASLSLRFLRVEAARVGGHKVPFLDAVGCLRGSRRFAVTVTAAGASGSVASRQTGVTGC